MIPAVYSNAILGAAIFDLSGLPREYFTPIDSSEIGWVQTVFQALGLQSLLLSSLQLEGFRYARIHGNGHCAIVVRQKLRYIALLLDSTLPETSSPALIQWLQELEPHLLKKHPPFNVA